MSKVPKLRFPEFEGEWEEKELENILEYERPDNYIVSDTNYSKVGIPVLTANKSFILGYTEENEGVFKDIPVIIFDDFTTDKKYVDFPFKVKSSAIKILKTKKDSLKFIYEAMSLIDFEATEHKRYYISAYQKIPLHIPSIAEQQKIADCLSSLDELIEARKEKIASLKAYKKGLLEQLFPDKVSKSTPPPPLIFNKLPKLRFTGFEGEWEEVTIESIFKITRGNVLPMTLLKQEYSEEYPYPVYSSQTKNNGLAGYYNEFLYENAITWTTDGANAGEVNYRKEKFYCTNVCGVLISEKGYANKCIAELINSVSKSYVSYVGNPKLMNGVMGSIKIQIPTEQKEQQKIANCLLSLDEKITAETEQVAQLQQHKKGLLQQLLV